MAGAGAQGCQWHANCAAMRATEVPGTLWPAFFRSVLAFPHPNPAGKLAVSFLFSRECVSLLGCLLQLSAYANGASCHAVSICKHNWLWCIWGPQQQPGVSGAPKAS